MHNKILMYVPLNKRQLLINNFNVTEIKQYPKGIENVLKS